MHRLVQPVEAEKTRIMQAGDRTRGLWPLALWNLRARSAAKKGHCLCFSLASALSGSKTRDYLPTPITHRLSSARPAPTQADTPLAAVQRTAPCDGKCHRNTDRIVRLNPLECPSRLVSRAARRGQGNRHLFYLRFVVQSVVR